MNKEDTYMDKNGYLRFKNSRTLVHRNVAYKKHYLHGNYPLPFSSYQVHHIDGNKENNHHKNLQIVTNEEHKNIHGIYNIPVWPYIKIMFWIFVLICIIKTVFFG